MNYTLNQIQIFLKVTETLSITKAAEELNLTQPAVSIQLKNFQDQFDIKLIGSIGRRIYITDFGLEIAQIAGQILNKITAINYQAQAHKGLLGGKLKLSVVSTGKYIIPYFITDFLKLHPGIDLIMDVTNKKKVLLKLKAKVVDFVLVSTLPKIEADIIDLLENRLYLIGGVEAKQYGLKTINKETLNQLPFVFREEGSATRKVMETYLDNHQIKVTKKIELTSNEAVKQAIIAGLGYSIMPLIGLRDALDQGLVHIIKSKDLPLRNMWQLVSLKEKEKEKSPVAKAFSDFILERKDAIVSNVFSWYEKY